MAVRWNVKWGLWIHGPGMVHVALGWNQDQPDLEAAVQYIYAFCECALSLFILHMHVHLMTV